MWLSATATVPAGPLAASSAPSALAPVAAAPATLTSNTCGAVRLARSCWSTQALWPAPNPPETAGDANFPTTENVGVPPLALGRSVELVSQCTILKERAIFVMQP